jgi:hypothetical protein
MENSARAENEQVIIEFLDDDGEAINITMTTQEASIFVLKLAYAIDQAKKNEIINYSSSPESTPGYAGEPTDINFGGSDF